MTIRDQVAPERVARLACEAIYDPGRCYQHRTEVSPTDRKGSIVAYANLSAALPSTAHPQAKAGYGKRTAPGQPPSGEHDFAHMPRREAEIGAYIDRLPDGSAIGYKALAQSLPGYGQQACGKALTFFSRTGHLRLVREHLTLEDGSFRWVTRTLWSRQARNNDWWRAVVGDLRGIDLTEQAHEAGEAQEEPQTKEPQEPPRARETRDDEEREAQEAFRALEARLDSASTQAPPEETAPGAGRHRHRHRMLPGRTRHRSSVSR